MLTQSYLSDRTYTKDEIVAIQRAINEIIYLVPNQTFLPLTGSFDPETQFALRVLQEYRRFEVTGTYTGKTSEFVNDYIKHKYANIVAYKQAADLLGVSTVALQALCVAVSGPYGFGPNSRAVIQFYPDRFYKLFVQKEGRGKALQIDFNEFKRLDPTLPLIDDHKESWGRLEKAMKLAYEIAIESTAFGLGLVPGWRHKELRFRSVYEFLGAVNTDEITQLELMMRDIKNSRYGLINAINRDDVYSIAKHYADRINEKVFISRYQKALGTATR